jgi:DNA-binding MarR family transcriptional regulator
MSRDPQPSRRETLLWELGNEVRASQRATDEVDEIGAEFFGINRTDTKCVDILDQHGSMSAGELARESRLTTGAITAVIDRLERAGIARRVADPSDRRRVLIELTEKARAEIDELMGRPMREAAEGLLSRYSDEQLELFIEFTRLGRELQERHANWLRQKLAEREASDAGSRGGRRLKGHYSPRTSAP